MKMSLRRGWVVLKSLKIPIRNIRIKDGPSYYREDHNNYGRKPLLDNFGYPTTLKIKAIAKIRLFFELEIVTLILNFRIS
jgi:hypothetical protein